MTAAPRPDLEGDAASIWSPAAAYLLSGVSLGVSWLHPSLGPLAWLSIAAMAFALLGTRRFVVALLGVATASFLSRWIGFSWTGDMFEIVFQGRVLPPATLRVLQAGASVTPTVVLISACFAATRTLSSRWRAGTLPLWLPAAWGLGEWVRMEWLSFATDDWLTTQWTMTPVLRALGLVGWWPTLGLCLGISATFGALAATKQAKPALALAVASTALGLALPPLPERGNDVLTGIAAIHMAEEVDLPHGAPRGEDIDLVVWPEDARHLRPFLREGQTPGATLRPLLPGADATHIIGLVTRVAGAAGLLNQAVVTRADGRVLTSRAKRIQLPISERRMFGLGEDLYLVGEAPTKLDAADRSTVTLICGELQSRDLVRQGVERGGEVLLTPARDQMMPTDRALRQFQAVQVLRSVEFGLPSVRASMGGWAYFISSAGRTLARSRDRTDSGFLMWDELGGARHVAFRDTAPRPLPPEPDVAVLFARDAPRFRTPCPVGHCRYEVIEDFDCAAARAEVLIVAGHGAPPEWLSVSTAEVARAIRCFDPRLVVLDTCFGASSELLGELAGLDAVFVGASTMIPTGGLIYEPAFFRATDPRRRAEAVRLEHGELLRWTIDPDALRRAVARTEDMSDAALSGRIARRNPPQVRVDLDRAGELLVPIDAARARVLQARRPRRVDPN